jgi:hypothetical protein
MTEWLNDPTAAPNSTPIRIGLFKLLIVLALKLLSDLS